MTCQEDIYRSSEMQQGVKRVPTCQERCEGGKSRIMIRKRGVQEDMKGETSSGLA